PPSLSAASLFTSVASLSLAPGLVPFDVIAPLWSDGATKDRAIALPGVESITWSQDGAWQFPVGTTLVKTFHLPLVVGLPPWAVPVETRVLIRTANGWAGYSYRWRDDQTDADLLPDSSTRTL